MGKIYSKKNNKIKYLWVTEDQLNKKMGCLNDHLDFPHWFGNIHFSGPCNRACYFCIGQHMPGQDPHNNLSIIPFNLDLFIDECLLHEVNEVNLTGTNTDPMLHDKLPEIIEYIRNRMPNVVIGLRTNGAIIDSRLSLFDKMSVSVTTFDSTLYKKTMGYGEPPDIKKILFLMNNKKVKLNIVQCPEVSVVDTILAATSLGIKYINIREPYGQPRIGSPFADYDFLYTLSPLRFGPNVYGMQSIILDDDVSIVYWDVHEVGVKSVNLYADGNISSSYSVTLGHSKKYGKVLPQRHFRRGRQYPQWNYAKAF